MSNISKLPNAKVFEAIVKSNANRRGVAAPDVQDLQKGFVMKYDGQITREEFKKRLKAILAQQGIIVKD